MWSKDLWLQVFPLEDASLQPGSLGDLRALLTRGTQPTGSKPQSKPSTFSGPRKEEALKTKEIDG